MKPGGESGPRPPSADAPSTGSGVTGAAWWIPGIYALLSGLWITLSDGMVAVLATTPAEAERWSVLKGFGFVAITALLLHWGIRRALAREREEQRKAAQAVAEQKDELDAVLRTALDGFFIVEPSGRILQVNDSACAMLGYGREELIGMSLADVEATQAPGEIAEKMARILRDGQARFPSRHRRQDGTVIDVEVSVKFLPFGGGHVVAFVRDVTASRRAEEQLRQAQKMEAVGRLAGGIAHDFNNLLTVMLSASSFALEEAPAEGKLREDLADVRTAAEKARVLTRQLLAFSRQQILDPQPMSLNGVIRDTERILARLVGEHVVLRTELAPDLGVILADPGQMQQVLLNLAVNAQDAMPRGGTLTISTGNQCRPADCAAPLCPLARTGCVRLVVSDTGTGMDEATRSRIFEPFFTTKPVGKGTGLGLATVLGIVQQSRGNIRVESRPGEGARFEICFPRHEEGAEPPGPDAVVGGRSTGAPARILVVEDDEQVRRVTVRILRGAGFDVVAAASVDEARMLLADGSPSPAVLLTDVRMPGATGPEVAAEVAARLPGIRTVFMSGWPDDELSPQEGIPTGALFVQKPFTDAGLVGKIRQALEG